MLAAIRKCKREPFPGSDYASRKEVSYRRLHGSWQGIEAHAPPRSALILLARTHALHLNSRLVFDVADEILALLRGQALVTLLVGLLELHICGRARPPQDCDPVLHNVALSERPMTIDLGEFVGVEIFSGRLTAANQEQVVSPQRRRIRHCHAAVNDHSPWHSPLGNGGTKGDILARHVDQDVSEAGTNEEQGENRTRAHECEKVAIVAAPNAIVEPDAMVVKGLYTVVANTAMVAARRSPDIAGLAIFHWYIHGSNIGSGQLNHDPIICGWAKY